MDVAARIRDYVARTVLMHADASALGLDDPLLETGLVDSLGLQNIITFIEEEFGIEVDDDDLKAENFQTVTAMTKLVEGKS